MSGRIKEGGVHKVITGFTVRSLDDDERVIEGIASTSSVDRMGDVVEPLGVTYKLPLPLLHQHRHDAPIGFVEWAKATKDGIRFRARLVKIAEPGPLRDRVDTAWLEIKSGLVSNVSIGFRALEYAHLDGGGIRFVKWEWYELSVVTVPAQADAEILAARAVNRGHIVKLGTPAAEHRLLKLTPADMVMGRALEIARKNNAGKPHRVIRLAPEHCTPEQLRAQAEADRQRANYERALAELEARQRRQWK